MIPTNKFVILFVGVLCSTFPNIGFGQAAGAGANFNRTDREHPLNRDPGGLKDDNRTTTPPAPPAAPAPQPQKEAPPAAAPKVELPAPKEKITAADIEPLRQAKEILSPEKLAARANAINDARKTIAERRGIDPSEVRVTDLYREISPAHRRGAFDVSVKGATDIHTEAKAISEKLGRDYDVIVEEPNFEKGEQRNTTYRGGTEGNTRTGKIGEKGFKATAPHYHAQPIE